MDYKKKYISILYSLIIFTSCSFYSFKGALPENINSIYLSQISNATSEYRITNLLNETIRASLISQNILDIVDEYNSDICTSDLTFPFNKTIARSQIASTSDRI